MSGAMASRFTSASSGPKGSSDEAADSSDATGLHRPAAKPQDPAEAAAHIGMFGPMTRSSISFYPARLLCKRFNVRPPGHVQQDPAASAPSGGTQTAPGPKELVSQAVMIELVHAVGATSGSGPPPRPPVVVEPERNDALEADRPGEAVFKAIFGSDDEGDGED